MLYSADTVTVNSQEGTSGEFSLISGCVCSSYSVTYTCRIFGGGNTLWNGTAFSCPSNSDSNNNQILLRHSGFGTERNSVGTCNGGAITGEGVSSTGGFTSQLNVTITSDLVGRQVSCYYENGSIEILVGNSTIQLTSAGIFIIFYFWPIYNIVLSIQLQAHPY